jgi:hypothetical protein
MDSFKKNIDIWYPKSWRNSIFQWQKTRTGIFITFIGITFEHNEIFSWCKFHNKEEIKGFNMMDSFKKNIDIWYPKSWQDSIFQWQKWR